jgi:hypothetical protein
VQLRGAGDRHDPRLPGQNPGERDLRGRRLRPATESATMTPPTSVANTSGTLASRRYGTSPGYENWRVRRRLTEEAVGQPSKYVEFAVLLPPRGLPSDRCPRLCAPAASPSPRWPPSCWPSRW